MKRRELPFQGYIIDSYERQGGYGRKWATELAVGVPDLILSMRPFGCHLMEVKHRPEWDGSERENPLTPKQVQIAKKYYEAGALVLGAVITLQTKAIGSALHFFDPKLDRFVSIASSGYKPGVGYNVRDMLLATRQIDTLQRP